MLWQPYFAGVGWNPFMDGAWAWYPGMGYMWASAYPWGWMPYYYGNWMFVPGFGWGWQPGGWNTWRGGIHYVGAADAGFHAPVAPKGTVSTVAVGRGGPVMTNTAPMRTVIRSGSAGLTIPRGSYENLRHLNTQVAKTGSVELRGAPQFAGTASHSGGYGYGAAHAASARRSGPRECWVGWTCRWGRALGTLVTCYLTGGKQGGLCAALFLSRRLRSDQSAIAWAPSRRQVSGPEEQKNSQVDDGVQCHGQPQASRGEKDDRHSRSQQGRADDPG